MIFLKKTLKYFAYLLVLLFVLMASLYLFIQTETFNKFALNYALSELNESESWIEKDNFISVESVNGNLLQGIRINNAVITVKKDTLLSVKYLDLKYNIFGLLYRTISVDYAVLNSPVINLFKIKDDSDSLVWNFSNLLTPSTDTSKSEFNWDVYVNSFKIDNGNFKILDTIPSMLLWALKWDKQNEFGINKLDVSGFELDLSGEYSKTYKKLNLKNLAFITNSDFILKKFALDAYINENENFTEINNFELISDRSDIKISKLSAFDFNPLDSNAFDNYMNTKIAFTLNVDKFNFADLRYFLPTVDMLDSSVSLYLSANGVLNNLDVSKLTLNLPESGISIKGNIKNLNNTDSMYLDVVTTFNVTSKDINTVLNINSLPDFRRLGMVYADITYKGNILDFYSVFNIRTSGGNVKGQGGLNINTEKYFGNVTTNNLNLASVLNNNKYKSNINISADFDGSGYTPKTMSTNVKYKLRNSNALGYSISNSSGIMNIHRNNVGLNVKANSTSGDAVVAGKINISNMNNPVYSFKGTMNNVDVSRFSGNNDDKSNLNAQFDINGSGIDLKNLAGRFDVNFGESYYAQYQIPKSFINASINPSSDSSYVNLSNTAVDIKTNGKFNLYSLINAVLYNVSMVSNIVQKKMYPDSVFVNNDFSNFNNKENINFNYQIVTKDSAEFRKLSSPFGFMFDGKLNGNFSNSQNGFKSKSALLVKNFVYNDTSIVMNNLNGNISLSHDYSESVNENPLSSLKINMDLKAGEFQYGSTKLDSLNAVISLSDSEAKINAFGKLDSLKYAIIKSNADLRGTDLVLNVDSLYVKYNDYDAVNSNKWSVIYIPQQKITIKQLGLKTGNMNLNVDGFYSLIGSSDLNINGDNINFGKIYEMLRPFDTTLTGEKNLYPVQGEIKKLFVHIDGTPDDANISLEIKTNIMKYDSIGIGSVSGDFIYKDQVLSPDIIITNFGDKGSMKLKGNIPFDNPLVEIDSTAARSDKPAELHLIADNFQIQYFTKLFPGLGDLQGILNGNIEANGTYYKPDLKGNLSMVKGKYFLDLTGMFYDFKFNVSTVDSKLLIDFISIYNPDDDTKHIDFRGTIDFKGYTLNNIDLSTSGDMVLLDKSNKENRLGLKGYILGGIGNPPVTIKGNLDKLNVQGQFVFKDATIASLPDSRKGYQQDNKSTVFISSGDSAFISDTTRRKIKLPDYESLNPFLRNRYILFDTVKNISILEMLALDLSIKTEKNMNVSIDFKNLTRDRLFGEVIADLRLRSRRGVLLLNGEVNVVGNSYYRFYRDFKVKESKIVFKGPIDKPELDIRAVYADTKSTEQYGTITNSPIQVVLNVKGDPSNPEITLSLYENGTEMLGNDATSDALTFLLFGKYKNELSASESQSVAVGIGSTVGSLYVTSFLGQMLRDVVPFIKDAEFNYTEGGLQNTNINVSSEIYGANVTVGSRVINDNAYLEFNFEYPLNDLLKLKLPEKVLLNISREQLNSSVIANMNSYYTTGLKIAYKFKF